MKKNKFLQRKKKSILAKCLKALPVVTALFMIGCSTGKHDKNPLDLTWNQVGLDGLVVNRLELIANKLYAITDDGLYVMDVESGNGFAPLGLQDKNILDLVDFGQGHLMASYRNPNDWEDFGLYETFDGGNNWLPNGNAFGENGQDEAINDFYWDGTNSILYATGVGVLAKSLDKGATWELIYGYWTASSTFMMIELNPNNMSDIWFGGQGGIENGYLVHMRNGSIAKEWGDLVPNPSVVKDIYFDGSSTQNIYVGWEGALLKTSDNGTTWTTLIDEHAEASFFFGIGVSATNSDLVFSGKWNKGMDKQRLTLYYSMNGGNNWFKENYLPEKHGGILDLKILNGAAGERIFLALDKGGVYEVTYELSDDLDE
ncbi:MAG: hypothetical protein VXW38_01700 [Bacteroidota bacterium]|nr:hypothetical protein [Bacteroidota bacterium]